MQFNPLFSAAEFHCLHYVLCMSLDYFGPLAVENRADMFVVVVVGSSWQL